MNILYEDNHIIAVNKQPSEISQSDKTGDISLLDKTKKHIKLKYNKPGNVFLGLCHRLDRPVSGVILFAKTSKCLSRLNNIIKEKKIKKEYWAIVKNKPKEEKKSLINYIKKNSKHNKSYIHENKVPNSKIAILEYSIIHKLKNYYLLKIILETGRSHQIRTQLSYINCPIKGDVKYGFDRANKDRSIHLHARSVCFEHPVTKKRIKIICPTPNETIWNECEKLKLN